MIQGPSLTCTDSHAIQCTFHGAGVKRTALKLDLENDSVVFEQGSDQLVFELAALRDRSYIVQRADGSIELLDFAGGDCLIEPAEAARLYVWLEQIGDLTKPSSRSRPSPLAG
jgi:hypothetical protein